MIESTGSKVKRLKSRKYFWFSFIKKVEISGERKKMYVGMKCINQMLPKPLIDVGKVILEFNKYNNIDINGENVSIG